MRIMRAVNLSPSRTRRCFSFFSPLPSPMMPQRLRFLARGFGELSTKRVNSFSAASNKDLVLGTPWRYISEVAG
jgi:hypothetical protein